MKDRDLIALNEQTLFKTFVREEIDEIISRIVATEPDGSEQYRERMAALCARAFTLNQTLENIESAASYAQERLAKEAHK